MTYATVMVHLDHDRANDAQLRAAGRIAERFGAGVIGIAACELAPPTYFVTGPYAAMALEESRACLRKTLAGLEQQFRAALQPSVPQLEWRSELGFASRYVIDNARAADLVIVGAGGEDFPDPWSGLDRGQLLMEAGRPVLVVPPEAPRLDFENVLIAWKQTREARRAVLDALPLLQQAREVVVLEVIEGDEERAAARTSIKDVVEWLRRHKVSAFDQTSVSRQDAAQQIEQIAAKNGASLIVAGGYGHGRLREWAFGGVTRSLLYQGKRCALLSH